MTLFRWNRIANEYYLIHEEAITGVRPYVVIKGNTYHVSYDLEKKYPEHGRIVYSSTQIIYPNIGTYDSILLSSPYNYSVRITSISDLKIKEWIKLSTSNNPFASKHIIPLVPTRVPLLTRALSGKKEYSLTLYSRTDNRSPRSKSLKIHSTHLGYMEVEGA